jgi:glycosyltransferase involved in cell wall biosynthesis
VNHYLDIAFPAIRAARRCNIPLICSVGTQLQSLDPARDRVLNALDRLICGRLVFPACARVIAWDTQILRYLDDVHGQPVTGKTVIVNYGVNGDPARFLAHRHDYARHNQILGVGAVSEQRSFVPLVRAFHRLVGEFPALRLKIIGHVYFDAAVRLASELGLEGHVTFADEMPHARVLEEMGRSDVLYSSLTAKYVGLGTATIESMLMGLPTVANTPLDLLGGPVLEDGVHLVHCPGDADHEIAASLRRVLTDEALRRRVGEGGRRFIQEYMNWDKVARDMEAAIAPLVH